MVIYERNKKKANLVNFLIYYCCYNQLPQMQWLKAFKVLSSNYETQESYYQSLVGLLETLCGLFICMFQLPGNHSDSLLSIHLQYLFFFFKYNLFKLHGNKHIYNWVKAYNMLSSNFFLLLFTLPWFIATSLFLTLTFMFPSYNELLCLHQAYQIFQNKHPILKLT